MSILSWLPGALKDLLKHVPTLLFEVVDWSAMSEELPKLTQRLLTGAGVPEVRQGLATVLPPSLRFGQAKLKSDLSEEQSHSLGELILELYFVSVLSGKPMFLDLRCSNFSPQDSEWAWAPGNLWGEFSRSFASGVRELYAGFFDADDERFMQGLRLTGLVSANWELADQQAMAKLLKDYFQRGAGPMAFSLQEFQQSFQKVFDFLLQKKGELKPDFIILGIMLVTLYLALEELSGVYEVKRAYQRALTRL